MLFRRPKLVLGNTTATNDEKLTQEALHSLLCSRSARRLVAKWSPQKSTLHRYAICASGVFFETSLGSVLIKVYNNKRTALHELNVLCVQLKGLDGLPKVLDSVINGRISVVVFQFAGTTAKQLLSSKHCTPTMWLQAIIATFNTLSEMHSLGWAHGDIKPSSLAFDRESWYLLGTGKAVKFNEQKPRQGTPPFCLPTSARSQNLPHEVCVNADRFAFAMTMLSFVGWPMPGSCEICVGTDLRCYNCVRRDLEKESPTFEVIPIEYLVKMRLGIESRIQSIHFGWTRDSDAIASSVADKIVVCLLDVVLEFLDFDKRFIVWDPHLHSNWYIGNTQTNLVQAYREEKPIQRPWQLLATQINQ